MTADAGIVRLLLRVAEGLSVPRDALVDEEMLAGGLDFDDPDRRLPYAWIRRVWTRLVAARPDEPLGAHVARAADPTWFGAFGYLLAHSRSLGEAFGRLVRFQRLSDPRTTWAMGEERGAARMALHADPWVTELRHPVEALIATAAASARLLLPEATPARVDFAHPPPARAEHAAALAALCGAEIRFGAAESALTYPRELLDRPLPGADPRLGAILERHARAVLAALPEPEAPLPRRVQSVVAALLSDAAPDVAAVARALGTSRRTLQRRLAEEGTSFAAIVDEARRVRALELIADRRVRLVEIAFLTGFAEARAFARAFRRWTGESPAERRRRFR